MPDPEAMFAGDASADAEERIDRAEAAPHAMSYRNAPQLRLMLAQSLTAGPAGKDAPPKRQNRRTAMIEAALEPLRAELDAAQYRRLCQALALAFGTESMIVCSDILQLAEAEARTLKGWTARAGARRAAGEPGWRRARQTPLKRRIPPLRRQGTAALCHGANP